MFGVQNYLDEFPHGWNQIRFTLLKLDRLTYDLAWRLLVAGKGQESRSRILYRSQSREKFTHMDSDASKAASVS